MEYGLALSGGGIKGAAHVGILKALEEAQLLPTSIAGTSSGSIVAGFYAAGMRITELYDVVTYLSHHGKFYLDPDYIGLLTFLPQLLSGKKISLSGFLKGNRLNQFLCDLSDHVTLSDITMKLTIPAVDLNTGQTIVYTNSDITSPMENLIWEKNARLCDVMMASSSVPSIFRPKTIGNYDLVDGGVTNNLPVDIMVSTGVKQVIAVDLGSRYQAPYDHSIIEIVSHSFQIMNFSLKDCMSRQETLLLKPQLKKEAGLLTFRYMTDCMEEGYLYGKKMIPFIKRAFID